MSDRVILGDKGYLSQNVQIDLFDQANIELETPKRKNQKDYQPQFYQFKNTENELRLYFHNYATSL